MVLILVGWCDSTRRRSGQQTLSENSEADWWTKERLDLWRTSSGRWDGIKSSPLIRRYRKAANEEGLEVVPAVTRWMAADRCSVWHVTALAPDLSGDIASEYLS